MIEQLEESRGDDIHHNRQLRFSLAPDVYAPAVAKLPDQGQEIDQQQASR